MGGAIRRLQRRNVDAAFVRRRKLVDAEAALRRSRGVRSVGGFRNEDPGPGLLLTLGDDGGTDGHHAAELTMRTGFRAHRHGAAGVAVGARECALRATAPPPAKETKST